MALARSIMSDRQVADFERTKEGNFAISPPGIGRFRVNAFIQQGKVGMVLRVIPNTLPTIDGLGVPPVLKEIADLIDLGSGSSHPVPSSTLLDLDFLLGAPEKLKFQEQHPADFATEQTV